MNSNHSDEAAQFIEQANTTAYLMEVKKELSSIAGGDFPRLVSLIDLLQEQKAIADDKTLTAAFHAFNELLCLTWDRVEKTASRLSSEQLF